VGEAFAVAWARPWALVLLPLALAPLAVRLARQQGPRLRFPGAEGLARGPAGLAARLWWIPTALVTCALALGAVALARPQSLEVSAAGDASQGIDLVLALDVSTSMRAADFRPRDRLSVAKEVLADLVSTRGRDRVGLVVFARQAWIRAPLSRDLALVRALVEGLDPGAVEDGTAIGDAIATSVNRLRGSAARSKAVVLVTDGDENASRVPPVDAARAAAALGVKVFTVLVGRGGRVPFPADVDALGQPVYREVELPVNAELLDEVAAITGAEHYEAVDRESLSRGLGEILDGLERSRLEGAVAAKRPVEHAPDVLALCVLVAAGALALSATRLGSFP
jgi:Ca-activated chloride channel family protein